mmetsp:Transcript_58228/g.189809  ORF Transcript_58228/g.189809 Transcript_58228/m.189809 type:complete len:409 (-) Transcript_58228:62-1288(-)
MAGSSSFSQRVIGNKIQTGAGYQMPEGWNDSVPTDPTWKMGGSEEKADWALVVMEPDTTLNLKPSTCSNRTYIQMFKKTEELVDMIKTHSAESLQKMMGLSEKSAKSHADRFQTFHKLPPKQAFLILGGEHFGSADWTDAEMKYMETHLRFVAGLYGVLRPFDDVKPVRDLPPSAELVTKKGKTVLDFWGDAVAKDLMKIATSGDAVRTTDQKRSGRKVSVLLILSDEYIKIVQPETFPKELRVVQIAFEGTSDSRIREARQKLGIYVIKRKLTNDADLQDWDNEDWKIDRVKSTNSRVVFSWFGAAGKKDKKGKKDGEKDEKGKSRKKEKSSKGKDKKDKREPSESGGSEAVSRSRSRQRGGNGGGRTARGRKEASQDRSRSRGDRRGGGEDRGGGRRDRRRRSDSE